MEMEFFQTISAEPNEKEFFIVIDEGMRIMKDLILDKSPNLIAIASIYVPAALLLVYEFLVQKGLNLLKDGFENGENKPKEVLRYLRGDICCVTLQRKLMEEEYVYMLQATQKNEFCSFVIADEMVNETIGEMFSYRVATVKGKSKGAAWQLWRPTGFAIMPDGFKGLESNASEDPYGQNLVNNLQLQTCFVWYTNICTRSIWPKLGQQPTITNFLCIVYIHLY
ncbi:hypothetical protein Dsin_029921 [Dipteronia sinensis]|uniref:Uncharacterized protein n=1 Tax=Dipteronia sinensis TaxID=43782 RepID=A0AAE0DVT9_9ROSI|nr:hypothetical protein Dsin_029921 [Dipteronia sinensis]